MQRAAVHVLAIGPDPGYSKVEADCYDFLKKVLQLVTALLLPIP